MPRAGDVIIKPGYSPEGIYDTCLERLPRLLEHLDSATSALKEGNLEVVEEMLLRTLAQVQHDLHGTTPLCRSTR